MIGVYNFFYEASESRRNENEKYFHDSRSHIAPAQSSLAMMIHFIFYRFAINPMPYCLNQFHFCSTYAWVSYFLNMIRVVKKTGKAKKTWLSDYAISASNFDLAPKSFISQFFFVQFWKFLSVFLECESNGRKNTIQLIYDCRWRGQQSAKNRQTEQRKLRDGFFGVIWNFPRSSHGRVFQKLTAKWRKSFLRHQLIINASSDGKANKTLCQKNPRWNVFLEIHSRNAFERSNFIVLSNNEHVRGIVGGWKKFKHKRENRIKAWKAYDCFTWYLWSIVSLVASNWKKRLEEK